MSFFAGTTFRRGIFALACIMALAMLAALAFVGLRTRDEMRLASQRAVRVAELRGAITYFDEWLTMSAQMAVATGETRWIARFDEAAPRLAGTVEEAVALASPEIRAELKRTTDEAYRDLADMQRAAFALAARGERDAARQLLNGPEFSYLKAVYSAGMEAFERDLAILADAQADSLNRRAWLEMLALALSATFAAAAVLALRGHQRMGLVLASTEHVAKTDALTELPNRRHLFEVLHAILGAGAPGDRTASLLLLDLDRFKAVNDRYGHSAGDRLLRAVAERLRLRARRDYLVARLGGDEFALLVRGSSADVGQRAQEIVEDFRVPFDLGSGRIARIGASVGVALTRAGMTPEEFLHEADVALYRAKEDGRDRFHVFDPETDHRARSTAMLEDELRGAIADGTVEPYFQPLVEIATGRLIGFEMLARWPHPNRGLIPPAEFVAMSEETGLISPLTQCLFRKAFAIAATWPADVVLACNISPMQLRDPGFPATVLAAAEAAGLPPSRLELEVTETGIVGDFDLARDLLMQFRHAGVRLALDDFGTGHSSLRHLQALPFDTLKIDATFVRAMAADPESHKIVAAVAGLGRSLGLTIVAEGVETADVARALQDLGCDVGQGWHFGRPEPAAAAQLRLMNILATRSRESRAPPPGGKRRSLGTASAA